MNKSASDNVVSMDQPGGAAYVVAVRSAAVAGVFSLVVAALLLYDLSQRRAEDPHETAAYQALKLGLAQQPDNEPLRQQIRELDQQLRQEYFRARRFTAAGAWLLVGGVVMFLVAAKTAGTLRRQLPHPQPQAAPVDRETGWTQTARWSVAGLAVFILAVALGVISASRAELPEGSDELAALLRDGAPGQPDENGGKPGQDTPSAADPNGATPAIHPTDTAPWPRFRGPEGSGVSAFTNVPESWDDLAGENIVWKTPVPLPGLNSPVVWGNGVFLSGATKLHREVYCFDATTGDLIWKREVVAHPQSPQMGDDLYAGFAAPTVAVVDRYVVAIFADGQLAAFDFDGNPAWQKSLGMPDNHYGHASSLVGYRDLVLVQMDQGTVNEPKSKLHAFHVATGEPAWEIDREVAASWTTPIVFSHEGRDQLVTCSDPWVISYDPADGTELWWAYCVEGESGPSPVFANGMVYVGNESSNLTAIRVDGSEDVTETHIAWTGDGGRPDTCSPLATEEFVFLLAKGALMCYDASDGTMLWEEYDAFDYPTFGSSPSLVGNRVLVLGKLNKDETDAQGRPLQFTKSWLIEPSRTGCKVVAEGQLDEPCESSPAFQDGRIYLRGEKHLFCIGAK